jgi:mRNA interferase RelE/StbE
MSERYSLEFTESARDDLKRIDRTTARRILKKLEWLAENAAGLEHIALRGEWGGHFKLRVGDYRVIYRLDHGVLLIVVIQIGHRREVYDG